MGSSGELFFFYPQCNERWVVLHDNGFYEIARKYFEELRKKGLKKEKYWVMRA